MGINFSWKSFPFRSQYFVNCLGNQRKWAVMVMISLLCLVSSYTREGNKHDCKPSSPPLNRVWDGGASRMASKPGTWYSERKRERSGTLINCNTGIPWCELSNELLDALTFCIFSFFVWQIVEDYPTCICESPSYELICTFNYIL